MVVGGASICRICEAKVVGAKAAVTRIISGISSGFRFPNHLFWRLLGKDKLTLLVDRAHNLGCGKRLLKFSGSFSNPSIEMRFPTPYDKIILQKNIHSHRKRMEVFYENIHPGGASMQTGVAQRAP